MDRDLPDRPDTGWSQPATIATLYGGLAFAGVVWRAVLGDINIFVHPRVQPWLPTASLGAGAALGLGVVALSRLATRRFSWARTLHREFRQLLGNLTPREVLLLAGASAIGEECFFRGAMQVQLGLLPASVIFALLHVGPGWRYLPWTLSALFVGLLMGWSYEFFGDLGAPIAAHFTVNWLNLRHIVAVDADVAGSPPPTAPPATG